MFNMNTATYCYFLLMRQTRATEELNIDSFARERFGKLGKSWARLNVSELVAPILTTRNPDAKCISWKLVFLVHANGTESQTYNLALRWLHSKIMGSDVGMDDELLVSLPGLSMWKKWTDTQSNPSQVCCLSILRETSLGANQPVCEDDLIAGSSSLLFLASGSISWDIQRVQLHKLLMSIPSGASLPLLILYTDPYEENIADPSVIVIDRLGLHEADKTKISSLAVIFLYGSSRAEPANSFFDDNQLKEGIQWLANHSPLQPVLHLVNTHELALSHVRHSIAALENLKAAEIGPNHCISAFNEALDRSAEEIIAAASANRIHWPCPEISLLEDSSEERLAAEMYLPSIGWSSARRIEPIISTIKGCRLSSFRSDMSWLNQGSSTVGDLQDLKLAIEECLVQYLTQSTRLLNSDLAVKEATVMLQKGAGLELRGSCHYIVPRWAVIFRRIYNWQLMRLKRKELSEAYILARTDEEPVTSNGSHAGSKDLEIDFVSEEEGYQPLHPVQTDISLDELVEISCNVPFTEQAAPALKPSLGILQQRSSLSETNISESGEGLGEFACDVSPTLNRSEQNPSPVSRKVVSRLDIVYEKCTRKQDEIDERLYVFF